MVKEIEGQRTHGRGVSYSNTSRLIGDLLTNESSMLKWWQPTTCFVIQ